MKNYPNNWGYISIGLNPQDMKEPLVFPEDWHASREMVDQLKPQDFKEDVQKEIRNADDISFSIEGRRLGHVLRRPKIEHTVEFAVPIWGYGKTIIGKLNGEK